MPSNNSKYTDEIREQTARYVLEKGKSATSVAEEMGIDTNTVCKWVRDYRRKHNLPSYAEERGIKQKAPQTEGELLYKTKELERALKKKEKELADEKEKVEILKKSLHIFMQPRE
ncbi:MAG: transposase [Lachnospiraceae bacterium]|nr:transposase [Lachnospiraceae bacterium]